MSWLQIGTGLLAVFVVVGCGGEDTAAGSGGSGAASTNGGGGTGGASGTTDTSIGGAGGGTSSTTDTSIGGAGGGTSSTTDTTTTSTTTVEMCDPPGSFEEGCYTGPPDTLGVGACAAGYRECLPNGTWSPCQGDTLPQPEICETATDEDCDGANEPCTGPGSAAWVRVWGGTELGDMVMFHGLRGDAQGNVHIGGASSPNGVEIDFGGGLVWPMGAYLVRFDANGANAALHAWTVPSGQPFDPGPADRLVVANHAVGLLQYDGFILVDEVGFDGAPIEQWTIGYADDNNGSPDVCSAFMYESSLAASPHELTVSGIYRGYVTLGGQILTKAGFSHDVVVARIQEGGAATFVHAISSQEAGSASHARLPDGDIALLVYGSAPFVDGGVTLAASGKGYLLARVDGATGAIEWSKWLPGSPFGSVPCSPALQHVVALPDGGIAFWFEGAVTVEGAAYDAVFGVARFDGDGNALWVKPFPNAIDQAPDLYGGLLVTTDDGGLVWTGNVNGILDYDGTLAGEWSFDSKTKPIVLKLTASTGAIEWVEMVNPVKGWVSGLAPLPGGSVVVAGTFQDSLLITGNVVDAPSQTSGWAAKLNP